MIRNILFVCHLVTCEPYILLQTIETVQQIGWSILSVSLSSCRATNPGWAYVRILFLC